MNNYLFIEPSWKHCDSFALYEQFLLLAQCFQKMSAVEALESVFILEIVKLQNIVSVPSNEQILLNNFWPLTLSYIKTLSDASAADSFLKTWRQLKKLLKTSNFSFLARLFEEIGELMLSPLRWRTCCQLGQTFVCKAFSQTLCMLLLWNVAHLFRVIRWPCMSSPITLECILTELCPFLDLEFWSNLCVQGLFSDTVYAIAYRI